MKQLYRSLLAISLCLPLAAQAFVDERTQDKQVWQEYQQRLLAYAERNGQPVPETLDYRYGMQTDVVRTVARSDDPRVCRVIPQYIAYEDSLGTLRSLRYRVWSDCPNNN